MFFSITTQNTVSSFDLNIGLQTKNYFIWQILIAKLVYLVQYCPDNIFTTRVWGQVESRKIWVRDVRLESGIKSLRFEVKGQIATFEIWETKHKSNYFLCSTVKICVDSLHTYIQTYRIHSRVQQWGHSQDGLAVGLESHNLCHAFYKSLKPGMLSCRLGCVWRALLWSPPHQSMPQCAVQSCLIEG